MKILFSLFVIVICLGVSCKMETALSEDEKKQVEAEIQTFMQSVESNLENPSPDKYFDNFLHTDELAVATQGVILSNSDALLDTVKAHLSVVKKQAIKTVSQKIYVVNKEAAVLSAAKVSTITFLDDSQIVMPYAWTMLIVKREGFWKIAHAHN